MGKYEDFIEELQKDFEVPTEVSRKLDNTLNSLSEMPASKVGKSKVHKWITAVASTAAALALCTGILAANPVLAAKIPIIGKIFVRVGDRVTYSGDFNDKGEVLITEPTEPVEVIIDSGIAGEVTDATATAEGVSEATNATYTVSDKGMTFTASEVYCDGHSLYLTAKVESENGGFTDMTGYVNDDGIGERVKHMYAWGGGQTTQGIMGENEGQSLEGDIIDDKTFVGMMKIDFNQIVSGEGVFELELTMLGFDGKNDPIEENSIDVGHRYDGNWKLSIPYTVDRKDTKTIEVNEKVEGGFNINKVFISPYQAVVYLDAPYKTTTAEEFTVEEFNELWEEKNEEMVALGDEPVRYEDELNTKQYDEFDLGLYNQNNEKLQWQGAVLMDDQWVAKYAIKGLDVSTLQMFLTREYLGMIKAPSIEEARTKAIWSTVIDVK